MKKIYILLILCLSPSFQLFSENIPAFPGAEGYGKYITGGRGGNVVYVTHLKDNTNKFGAGYKGSLRAALETAGSTPITVVFKVGGVIKPQTTIECSRNNVTIAGQTALGDGICVGGVGINFSGNNIIVRHMRFRVGRDYLNTDQALNYSNGKKAIFDHCSFSWSREENVNITDVDSVTFQWCINSESLYDSDHPKGVRGYAAQWGGEHASYHHNLLAHHVSRMPRQNGNTSNDYQLTWDYRNNVHYNWGSTGAFYGGGVEQNGGFCHSNLINNYYIPGPATTTSKSSQYFCAPSGGREAVVGTGNEYLFGYGLWWLEGNVMFDNTGKTDDNWSGLSGPVEHYADSAFDVAPVTTTSAEQAYIDVLADAGATKPKRDSIDMRIIEEVKNRTALFGATYGSNSGIIDTQTDITPENAPPGWVVWDYYPEVKDTEAPVDTDGDGMPDWWETANGLDSIDINDGNALADDGSGYTNLEKYLNSDEVGQTGPTAIKRVEKQVVAFALYPNPVNESFKIFSTHVPEIISIYNLNGIVVASYNYNDLNNFSVSALPKGQYLVKVTFSNGQYAINKMIK